MLSDQLLIEAGPGEVRGAVMAAAVVLEVEHYRELTPVMLGAIYRGRVRRIDPGMNAAFIELGGGWRKDGFMRARDAGPRGGPRRIQQIVQEGATVIVQIVGGSTERDAREDRTGTKGPSVTSALALPTRYFDYLPSRRTLKLPDMLDATAQQPVETFLEGLLQAGEGLRMTPAFAAALAELDEDAPIAGTPLHRELAAALQEQRQRWQEIKNNAASLKGPDCIVAAPDPVAQFLNSHAHENIREIIVGDPVLLMAAQAWAAAAMPELVGRCVQSAAGEAAFDVHDVDTEIETALTRRVAFGTGGGLLIEPGETLTAIDVNSGGAAGKAGRLSLDVNLAAVPEIARQIRLRALAGPIVIDFMKMDRAADRDRVVAAMRAAVAADPVATHVMGLSPLGHLELTRQRRKSPLAEILLAAPDVELQWTEEAACYALLRVIAKPGRAAPPHLRVSREIGKLLGGTFAGILTETGKRLGMKLEFETDESLSGPQYELSER